MGVGSVVCHFLVFLFYEHWQFCVLCVRYEVEGRIHCDWQRIKNFIKSLILGFGHHFHPISPFWKKFKQESPPVWMQEAYWLWHIKYYSVGYPPPRPGLMGGYLRWGTPCQGTPQPGLTGGTWGGVPPSRGIPQPGLMGVPEVGYPPSQGTSWPGLMGVPEVGCLDLAGVPPPPGPGWGTPPPAWTWLGYPPGWGNQPQCGQTDGWTDMCENITFPSYYVHGW